MKIAIGTDDQKTIQKGQFSGSRYFVVMEILNAGMTYKTIRVRDSGSQDTTQNHDNTQAVMDLLKDCSLFMGASYGRDAVEEITSRGIDCISTTIEGIEDAVSAYLDGKVAHFCFYSRDQKDHIPCTKRPYI